MLHGQITEQEQEITWPFLTGSYGDGIEKKGRRKGRKKGRNHTNYVVQRE